MKQFIVDHKLGIQAFEYLLGHSNKVASRKIYFIIWPSFLTCPTEQA